MLRIVKIPMHACVEDMWEERTKQTMREQGHESGLAEINASCAEYGRSECLLGSDLRKTKETKKGLSFFSPLFCFVSFVLLIQPSIIHTMSFARGNELVSTHKPRLRRDLYDSLRIAFNNSGTGNHKKKWIDPSEKE